MESNLLDQEEDTQHGRFLTFTLGSESFGIEIAFVTEIVGMQPVTPMPEASACVKGIINLRGRIIPVIDIRLKFGKAEVPYDDRTCIIVINVEDTTIGLIVDMVAEVLTIEDENIVPPPSTRTGAWNRYVKAIGRAGSDVKLLLDCGKLFNNEEIAGLEL